jgi:hypothetical protein
MPRAKKHPKLSADERAFLNRLCRLNEEEIKQLTTREIFAYFKIIDKVDTAQHSQNSDCVSWNGPVEQRRRWAAAYDVRGVPPKPQAIFFCRRHQPRRPPPSLCFQLAVTLTAPFLQALRCRCRRVNSLFEGPGSALKEGVKVRQWRLVNEVLGLLLTEFFPDPTHKGATPIQGGL